MLSQGCDVRVRAKVGLAYPVPARPAMLSSSVWRWAMDCGGMDCIDISCMLVLASSWSAGGAEGGGARLLGRGAVGGVPGHSLRRVCQPRRCRRRAERKARESAEEG